MKLGWPLVLAAYGLGVLVFLWPMPAHLGSAIWGDRFDAWTTLWLIDHLAERLRTLDLSAVTTDILHPVGYNLWSFGHLALQALGAVLVVLGVPLVAAYNLLLIGGLWSSAVAAHALGKELTGSHLPGFVAGTVFATSPYLYGEGAAGCIELVAAGLLPLHALMLLKLVREPTVKRAAWATAVLAVIGPFNWYYTLFAGMFALGFLAWVVVARRVDRRGAGLMLASMVAAALIDVPLILEARRETPTRPPVRAELFEDAEAFARAARITNGVKPLVELTEDDLIEMDALEVFLNSTPLSVLIEGRFELNPLRSSPGALAWIVGLAGWAAAGRRNRGWMALAAGATVLTLGPFPNLAGKIPLDGWAGDWTLPYGLAYEHVPFFSKAYRPYRIGIVTSECLAAAGAVGMASLMAVVPVRVLAGVAALLGGVAFSQPFWAGDRPGGRPLADASVPAIYEQLAELPEGAVIELPLQYQPVTIANAKLQYYQVVHRKPLLNCNQLIRRPDLMAFQDYVTGNAFLHTLLDLSRQPPPYTFTDADVAAVVDDGFRYLVVHRELAQDLVEMAGGEAVADMMGQPALSMLEELLGEPVLADGDLAVYQLPETWDDRDRVWTWTGEDVVDLDTPLDVRAFELPLVLPAGGSWTAWAGEARTVSFWGRPIPGDAGGLALKITSTGQQLVRPIELPGGRWSLISEAIPFTGPVRLELVAKDAPVAVELTQLQVVTR